MYFPNLTFLVELLSHVQFFVILWTVVCQAPLSMGFSRQEYWSGLPFPSPGDLPNPGINPYILTSPALANGFFTTSATLVLPKVTSVTRRARQWWLSFLLFLLHLLPGLQWGGGNHSPVLKSAVLTCALFSPLLSNISLYSPRVYACSLGWVWLRLEGASEGGISHCGAPGTFLFLVRTGQCFHPAKLS